MPKRSKSEYKMQLRERAQQKVRPKSGKSGSYNQAVESGRQRLMRESSEGGDPKAKKIKNELMYLLNNYTPQYDTRILALIDHWRTSGDPSYDPGIRVELRKARQRHMQGESY